MHQAISLSLARLLEEYNLNSVPGSDKTNEDDEIAWRRTVPRINRGCSLRLNSPNLILSNYGIIYVDNRE